MDRDHNKEDLSGYLAPWHCTPTSLCTLLQKRALPWPKALAKAMENWADSKIEDVFLQLELAKAAIGKGPQSMFAGIARAIGRDSQGPGYAGLDSIWERHRARKGRRVVL